ncbi:hypothetical protein cypCar_00040807 [Cyprinus carpio]|nr:hypothetical protein cypCar_00040807 [Cyprinus carpio]
MHARPSAIGKEPETEENFCRPGGVTSPHFSWPPARHRGRSQEVEWTRSDEEERLDGRTNDGPTAKWLFGHRESHQRREARRLWILKP